MKEIKILGTGCAKCKDAFKLIEETAKSKGFNGFISKVEDMAEIISYGVISLPAVVIDGKIVAVGSVLTKAQIENWFEDQKGASCGCRK